MPSIQNPSVTPSLTKTLLSWLKHALMFLLIFLLIYVPITWWRKPVMPAHPQLTLTDYQGQPLDLEAMSQQRPVLIYFWGSWCGVCKVTSPIVNTLATSSNYPVVTIAVKSGDTAELTAYLNQKGYDFTTINDPSGTLFDTWQGQVTPSFVILNKGEMTQGLTGIQPLWALKLRLWLSTVIK